MTKKQAGYRNYTIDGRYWTVRKQGQVYWVVLIDPTSGSYIWTQIWGGYSSPGAAAGAAAHLSYVQGKKDAAEQLRASLHDALDSIGLGVPAPKPAPVSSDTAPVTAGQVETGDADEEQDQD